MEEWDKPVINEIDINYTLGEAGGGDDLNVVQSLQFHNND